MNMVESKQDYMALSTQEWLVTNGLGGYASSTVSGASTRRYHGLLVASFNPPTERKVLVAKSEETVYLNDSEIKLSSNLYRGTIHPEGYKYIKEFKRDPFPATLFEAGQVKLLKTVFMVYHSNTTVVEYKNTSKTAYRLHLTPLYAMRDYHGLTYEDHNQHYDLSHNENSQNTLVVRGPETVYLKYSHGTFTEHRTWYKQLHYEIERERGMNYTEDLFSAGSVDHELAPGASIYLVFSTDPAILDQQPEKLKQNELDRLKQLVPGNVRDKFLADLLISGDQFVVQRKSTGNFSVIAGYHWFTDWGRDSMIAVRGLCIATGKQKEARSIITTFLNYLQKGIIPNRFPDYKGDEPEYHTMDATLWLFVAVYEYDQAFEDDEFLRTVYPKLVEIINYHLMGTKHNIRLLDNGLLYGGTMGLPLTWMDARIKDHIFTPRIGCPVEINALWYNALKIYEYVSERLKERPNNLYVKIRERVETQFIRAYWNDAGYLNDNVNMYGSADKSIRPNQIYAVSLPFSLLSKEQEKMVVENVKKELLTAYGLRTLSSDHPEFKSAYEGDLWARDAAYHQGTVWPFLLPEYFLAYLKVNKHSSKAKKEIKSLLEPLKEHFYSDACIHGISEIFDGLEPKNGKGCMNQAWSVSNLILLLTKIN